MDVHCISLHLGFYVVNYTGFWYNSFGILLV